MTNEEAAKIIDNYEANGCGYCHQGGEEVEEAFRMAIEALHGTTVDAVPVIRCKDCKYLRLTGTVWKCQNRLVMMLCEPNDYCSRAERKEE